MSSRDKVNSNSGNRILTETLRHVSDRRRRRQQLALSLSLPLGIAVILLLQWNFRNPETFSTPATIQPVIANTETPPITIQRIGAIEGNIVNRIPRSNHMGNTERLAIISSSPRFIIRITDDQLFASLPDDQTAALIRNPDGSSRLFLFSRPVPKH